MKYIEIRKEILPRFFEMELDGSHYILEIFYNTEGDFFTVNICDLEHDPIVSGAKLVYGEPLFSDIVDSRLPTTRITPIDPSGMTTVATYETMDDRVFLVVGDVEEEMDDEVL